VVTGPQDSVTLLSVTPDLYLKQPASLNEDISLAYMEVPLEGLDGNLNITVKFQFTHQTELYQVDPTTWVPMTRATPPTRNTPARTATPG